MAAIDELFDRLLEKGASDLHLGVGVPPLARSRGDLVPLRDEPLTKDELESMLYEIVSPEQRRTIDEDLDLDFAYALGDKARFRANYFWK
ncbi:MAG: type IV pili twitching motility protein PilT, partial [Polyangiales bacterium]